MEQYKNIVLEKEKRTNEFYYFTKISAKDRECVKEWLESQRGIKKSKERIFLEKVVEAVQKIDYDYWIATLEPSVANGNIYYAEVEEVGVGFSCVQWKQMAKQFAPERNSRLAMQQELILWYALRIAKGFWTLNYVCYSCLSEEIYKRRIWKDVKIMEKTGARVCGGYKDGLGNTYKIVTDKESFMTISGCIIDETCYPISKVCSVCIYDDCPNDCGTGVIVLTK